MWPFNRKRPTGPRIVTAKSGDEYLLVEPGYKPGWATKDSTIDELIVGSNDNQVRIRYLGDGSFETTRDNYGSYTISLVDWTSEFDGKDVVSLYPKGLAISLGISGRVDIKTLYNERALVEHRKPIWQS